MTRNSQEPPPRLELRRPSNARAAAEPLRLIVMDAHRPKPSAPCELQS